MAKGNGFLHLDERSVSSSTIVDVDVFAAAGEHVKIEAQHSGSDNTGGTESWTASYRVDSGGTVYAEVSDIGETAYPHYVQSKSSRPDGNYRDPIAINDTDGLRFHFQNDGSSSVTWNTWAEGVVMNA